MSLDRVEFRWRTTGTGPQSWQFAYSLDGFATDTNAIGLATDIIGGGTQVNDYSISLTNILGLQGFTNAVTFRLVGWGASSSSGSAGFTNNTTTTNALSIYGVSSSSAATGNYWAGATNGGGAGVWTTAGTNWATNTGGGGRGAVQGTATLIFADTAGTVTVSNGVSVAAGLQFATNGYTVTGSTITLTGADAASNTITTDAGVGATIDSQLSGSAGLTKAGAGTLTLGGANNYTGGTVVSAGELAGSTTSLQGNITNNAVVRFSQTTNGTNTGAVSGTGSLLKSGAGTVTLTGANTPGAGTLISEGALQIGAGGATGSLSGAITNNAALIVDRTGALTMSDVISGTGTFTKAGNGTVTLTAGNTFTGTTAISGGAITLDSASGNALSGDVEIAGGTLGYSMTDNQIADTADITMTSGTFNVGARTETVGSLAMAGGSLLKGGGALTLGGASSVTGGTVTLSTTTSSIDFGGTLTLGAAIFDYTSTSATANNIAVILGGNVTTTGSGTTAFTKAVGGNPFLDLGNASRTLDVIAGTTVDIDWGVRDGSLIKAGAGTLILSSAANVQSATTLSAGVLRAGADAALGSGGVTLNGGTISSDDATARTFANALTLGGDVTFGEAGTGALTFSASGPSSLGGGMRTLTTAVNTILAGALTNGSITKAGAGTLTLSNTASSFGSLEISAGEVALQANATISGLGGSGALTLGAGTLTVNGATNSTFGQAIGGAGGLTKSGAGTLTLTTNNTYTNATTVSGGTLVVNGTNTSSAVTVSGGTLAGTGQVGATTVTSGGLIAPGNSPGNLTVGDFTMDGGGGYLWEITNVAGAAGTEWDLITITGATSITATSAPGDTFSIFLTGSGITGWNQNTNYTWAIMDWSGGTAPASFDANVFTLNTASFADPVSGLFSLSTNATSLLLTYDGTAGSPAYTNGAGGWSTNFSPALVNDANAIFEGTGGTATNDITNGFNSIGSITFATNAGAYTLVAATNAAGFAATNALIAGGNIVNESSNTQTINLALSVAGNKTIDTTGANVVMNGDIIGTGDLVKIGANTLTLGGTNTFSGTLRAEGGTVDLNRGGSTAIGSTLATNATVALDGGTVRATANNNANFALDYGTLEIYDGGGTLEMLRTGTQLGTTFTNHANLVFKEAGTFTASRVDSDVATTFLFNGTANTLEANGTFAVSGGNVTVELLNALGESGGARTLTKTGTGVLLLAANNTYSGGTLISEGTVRLGKGGSTGSIAGAITNNATLAVDRSGSFTMSNAVSGSGNLVKAGVGTLVLSGANTYSGATTVAGGTLRIDGNSRLGNATNALTISNAAIFEVTAAGTLGNTITIGAGNGVLSNSSGGALVIAGAVSKNGTVFTSRSGSGTNIFTGVISGASANSDFIVDGGTTVFSNQMTYNGPTIITNGGTLVLGTNNATPAASGLVLGGGTLLIGDASTRHSTTFASLTLTADSTIDMGANGGLGTLTFGDSSLISWTGILTITNWQGVAATQSEFTKLVFGSINGLTNSQLAQIQFAGFETQGGVLLGAEGELAPIPEAPVVWGAAAVTAFIFWRERRRLLGIFVRGRK